MCDNCECGKVIADGNVRESYRYAKLSLQKLINEGRIFRTSRVNQLILDIESKFCALEHPTPSEIDCLMRQSGIECDGELAAKIVKFAKLYRSRTNGLD